MSTSGILTGLAAALRKQNVQRKAFEELRENTSIDPALLSTFSEVYEHLEDQRKEQRAIQNLLTELKHQLEANL